MSKDTDKEGSKDTEMMQAYLSVSDYAPRIVLRRASDESYDANLIPMPGIVVEARGDFQDYDKLAEKDSWDICSKIAERLSLAEQTGKDDKNRNSCCEHLAYAYSILFDYVRSFYGDYTISKETAETLIRGAIDRIVRAGKFLGLRLDQHRSDADGRVREARINE